MFNSYLCLLRMSTLLARFLWYFSISGNNGFVRSISIWVRAHAIRPVASLKSIMQSIPEISPVFIISFIRNSDFVVSFLCAPLSLETYSTDGKAFIGRFCFIFWVSSSYSALILSICTFIYYNLFI